MNFFFFFFLFPVNKNLIEKKKGYNKESSYPGTIGNKALYKTK